MSVGRSCASLQRTCLNHREYLLGGNGTHLALVPTGFSWPGFRGRCTCFSLAGRYFVWRHLRVTKLVNIVTQHVELHAVKRYKHLFPNILKKTSATLIFKRPIQNQKVNTKNFIKFKPTLPDRVDFGSIHKDESEVSCAAACVALHFACP